MISGKDLTGPDPRIRKGIATLDAEIKHSDKDSISASEEKADTVRRDHRMNFPGGINPPPCDETTE